MKILKENEYCFKQITEAHKAKLITNSQYTSFKKLATTINSLNYWTITKDTLQKLNNYERIKDKKDLLRARFERRCLDQITGIYKRPYLP